MSDNLSLFETDEASGNPEQNERLADGVMLLHGFVLPSATVLREQIDGITAVSPFRQMVTPGGYRMSVQMTSCGQVGWITDKHGYSYAAIDPLSGAGWPAMPKPFMEIAQQAASVAGFPEFIPDSCLINCYLPGTKLSLHQDKDEQDFSFPIVSISLGLTATFLFGGMTRKDKIHRIRLQHGDAVVWGGPSRLRFHGIDPLAFGVHPEFGTTRVNLTFRKAL
jgi:alkylated DNA repair protein (DNA oxidative demethylase)